MVRRRDSKEGIFPQPVKLGPRTTVWRAEDIYEFIKKEISSELDPAKQETNLATIIKILAKEDWKHELSGFETIPYDIERKICIFELPRH